MTLTPNRIAEVLSKIVGRHVSPDEIRPTAETDTKSQAADATLKFIVTLGSTQGFLIVSGVRNRSIVQRAVTNIEQARGLSGSAAVAIIPPIFTGDIDGRSFAIWEYQKPFPAGRMGERLTQLVYGSQILDWGLSLCKNSLEPSRNVEDQYILPLRDVQNSETWPFEMRRDAAIGLERIGRWRPMQCVQHGDFWVGNVLRSRDGGIAVVDWAGATIEGYPVFDMVRMLVSLNCKSRRKRHYTNALCDILSCELPDLVTYSLAAIGNLGMRLEFFPIQNYRKMSVEVYQYLVEA